MIQRRKPLKLSAPPRRRAKARRNGQARDDAYKAEVRTLPCIGLPGGWHHHDCPRKPPSDPSHVGRYISASERVVGRKSGDRLIVPHSRQCHDEWEFGKRLTREEKRAWAPGAVAETQTTVAANLAGVGGSPGIPF